jgi:hypothetical protein
VTFRRAACLLPAAFAVHAAEDAPGFVAWARRHASAAEAVSVEGDDGIQALGVSSDAKLHG